MNHRSIALVGLSGTGKSTVGRALANHTGMHLADIDAHIEVLAGQPIPAIFSHHGEAWFRNLETAALRSVLDEPEALVLATGAGIVLRAENRMLLRQHAFVVWLDAPTALLVARLLAHDEERPLLRGDDLAARLDALREVRTPLYQEIAHMRVETHGREPLQIVTDIHFTYRDHEAL